MRSRVYVYISLILVLMAGTLRADEQADNISKGDFTEGEKLFALKVQPIFTLKCAACHGDDPDELEGGFDMRTRESTLTQCMEISRLRSSSIQRRQTIQSICPRANCGRRDRFPKPRASDCNRFFAHGALGAYRHVSLQGDATALARRRYRFRRPDFSWTCNAMCKVSRS